MKSTKKNLIRFIKPILVMVIGVSVLVLSELMLFIPFVHNLIIITGIIIACIGLFLLNFEIYKTKSENLVKWLIFFISILITVYVVSLLSVTFLFTYKKSVKFKQNNKTYYIIDDGFMDPYTIIYEKNSMITMKKIQEYYIYFNEDFNNMSEKVKSNIINGEYDNNHLQ